MPAFDATPIPLPCTDADLKAAIEADLATSTVFNQFQAVCFIRDWAYRHKVGAAPGCNLLPDFHKLTASEFYNLMRTRGGFVCGGTSYFAKRLYEFMGFTAYSVDFGFTSLTATHVTNLVRIEHDGREILSLQDSYFNFTYTSPDGRPLCFTELQSLLRRRELNEIVTVGGPSNRALIAHTDSAEEGEVTAQILAGTLCDTHPDGTRIFECYWTLDTYLEATQKYGSALKSAIGEEDLRYLFLFPIGTSGEAHIEKLLAPI